MTRPVEFAETVFVYGTLRVEPGMPYGGVHHFDSHAIQRGESGGWRLPGYAIWGEGDGTGVPAVKASDPEHFVIGDVFDVTEEGFERLLRYEGYPNLYQFDRTVAHEIGDSDATVDVIVFTTDHAHRFGKFLDHGDYYRTNVRLMYQGGSMTC